MSGVKYLLNMSNVQRNLQEIQQEFTDSSTVIQTFNANGQQYTLEDSDEDNYVRQ